jgi:AraC family transcriptional regulator, arabinose operon regulatory protein
MYIFDHGQKRGMDFSLMNFENVQVFRSDPAFSGSGLSVSEFGKQRVAVEISERRLNDYAAVFVEEGQGVLTTERGGTLRVVGPALFWLFPNELHSYGPDGSSFWQERWALFRGTLIDEYVRREVLDPTKPLVAPVKHSEISQTFKALHADMLKRHALGWVAAAATIHRLIVQVAKQASSDTSKASNAVTSRITNLIEERAFSNIDFDSLADELNLSPATLRRKCVSHLGVAPKHYQLQLRFERAKELLTTTDRSVQDVAMSVGYGDSFYFSRLFFKRESQTPTDFRKLHRRL